MQYKPTIFDPTNSSAVLRPLQWRFHCPHLHWITHQMVKWAEAVHGQPKGQSSAVWNATVQVMLPKSWRKRQCGNMGHFGSKNLQTSEKINRRKIPWHSFTTSDRTQPKHLWHWSERCVSSLWAAGRRGRSRRQRVAFQKQRPPNQWGRSKCTSTEMHREREREKCQCQSTRTSTSAAAAASATRASTPTTAGIRKFRP